jgi:hypothetical protein
VKYAPTTAGYKEKNKQEPIGDPLFLKLLCLQNTLAVMFFNVMEGRRYDLGERWKALAHQE